MQPLDLLSLALGAWFLSYCIVKTDGPKAVFVFLRAHDFTKLTHCLYCLIFWVALTFYGLLTTPAAFVVYVCAAAGGGMLAYRYTGGDHA